MALPAFLTVLVATAEEKEVARLDVLGTGIDAAVAKEDAGGLYAVLEAGRAALLAQALQARTHPQTHTVDPKLRAELETARLDEARARLSYTAARRAGQRLAEIRRLRKRVSETQARHADVLTRVLFFGPKKAGQARLTPTPLDLKALRVLMGKDRVLVHYLVSTKKAWALVVHGAGARIVDLGARAPVAEALTAFGTPRADRNMSALLKTLQELLVTPLKLATTCTRVVVVPSIRFHHVPFGALLPAHDVIRAPSATVFAALLRSKPHPEAKGLGVVDPRAEGPGLAPLPDTRDEVTGTGNVILKGKDASETKFLAALAKQPHWRMIHFGTHVLIDLDAPMGSSIALTPDEQNDGLLTALEILRLKIPADLVVVTGCESLRGKLVKPEGVLGLHRSLLIAGARSVLGNLWCTDSAATAALMKRFHALWRPEAGRGLPAAHALRLAREHMRSQEKWKNPVYWAGWELVGDPD